VSNQIPAVQTWYWGRPPRTDPRPSAVVDIGRRAALDSANVNKYQLYKNLTILAVQIPAVQTWYWGYWGANGFFVAPARHWFLTVSSPRWTWQELGGNGEIPRCAEAGPPSKSVSFQNGKIIEVSCGRLCLRHLEAFQTIILQGRAWNGTLVPGVFSKKNYFKQTLQDVFSFRQSV